jgi:hypothetical protein
MKEPGSVDRYMYDLAWLDRLFNNCTKRVFSFLVYNERVDRYNPGFVSPGGIAQLGERLHGMQEVSGSIPLISTSFIFIRKL